MHEGNTENFSQTSRLERAIGNFSSEMLLTVNNQIYLSASLLHPITNVRVYKQASVGTGTRFYMQQSHPCVGLLLGGPAGFWGRR